MVATAVSEPNDVVRQRRITRRKKKALPKPPSGWLTRAQVQDLLDCSMNTVKNWEGKGLLHSRICCALDGGNYETHYYNPAELALVPRKQNRLTGAANPGEVAARVFEQLMQGKSVCDIVIALRYEPSVVEDLREQWLESNVDHVVVSHRTRQELERLFGGKKIENENDLVQLARAVVEGE
jgi:hypothetical protein